MAKETTSVAILRNPRKLLNKPDYFVTPVIPIVTSLPSGITETSNTAVIDAYNLFVTRIKDVAVVLSHHTQPPHRWPALESLQAHTHALSDCIVRDIGFVLQPWHCPGQRHLSPKEHARDSRTVTSTCHQALQLSSSLFAFPALSEVFSENDIRAMLDCLLSLFEKASPALCSKKTKSIAMWALTMQRLPGPILLPYASRIAAILEGVIKDRVADKTLLGDSFKALHSLLVGYPRDFLFITHGLFPYVLQKFHSSDRSLRLRAAYAVAGFARATSTNPSGLADPTDKNNTARQYLSEIVHRFAVQNCPSYPPLQSTAYKLSFWDRIHAAVPSVAEELPGEDAAWAFSALGSLVVLLDGRIFTTTEFLRPILEFLSKPAVHTSAHLTSLKALLWRCLHWSFTRIHSLDSVGPSRDPGLTPHEGVRAKFYTILRNGSGPGVRSALVYALLGPDEYHGSATSPPRSGADKDVKNALHLVQDLIADSRATAYHEGVRLLARMTAGVGNPSVAKNQIPWNPLHVLDPSLLDGALAEMPSAVFEASSSKFDVNAARSLSDAEVNTHWSEVYAIWDEALKRALDLGEILMVDMLDTWRALLLSKAVLTSSYARLDAPPDFTRTILRVISTCLKRNPPAGLQLTGAGNAPKRQTFRFRVTLSLWRAVTLVYCTPWLRRHSLAILNYVFAAEKDVTDPEVKAVWENLCVFIVLHGEPKLLSYSEPHLASVDINSRRAVWTKAAAAWQFVDRSAYSWQDICTFMTIPPRLWEMDSAEELEAWSWLLDHAILTAGKTLVSADVVLETLALELLVHSRLSHTLFPKIFTLFIPYLSLSDRRKIPATVLEEIGESMSAYDHGEVDRVLKSFAFFAERVRSCPPSCLVPFLAPLSNGLAVWIRDLERAIADEHHDGVVISFYVTVMERLASVRSTAEDLTALQELIGAPIVDDFRSPRAGLAFQRFCEHVCASHAFPSVILPPSIQRRLGAWYDALDIKDRPSFIGAESQTQAWSQFVDESTQQIVPDSQPPEDAVIDSSMLCEHPLVLEQSHSHGLGSSFGNPSLSTGAAQGSAPPRTVIFSKDIGGSNPAQFVALCKRRRSDDGSNEDHIFKKPKSPPLAIQDPGENVNAPRTNEQVIPGVGFLTYRMATYSSHEALAGSRSIIPDSQVPDSQPVDDSLFEVPDSQI